MAKEYIERDELLQLYDPKGIPDAEHLSVPFLVVRQNILDATAADVRPVVLCRDCRFFYNGTDEKCCINHLGVVKTDENGYCHHAQRRAKDD